MGLQVYAAIAARQQFLTWLDHQPASQPFRLDGEMSQHPVVRYIDAMTRTGDVSLPQPGPDIEIDAVVTLSWRTQTEPLHHGVVRHYDETIIIPRPEYLDALIEAAEQHIDAEGPLTCREAAELYRRLEREADHA
jgi:hypothetical protein